MTACGECGCALGAGECVAHHEGCSRLSMPGADLDDLEQKARAATPGPWASGRLKYAQDIVHALEPGKAFDPAVPNADIREDGPLVCQTSRYLGRHIDGTFDSRFAFADAEYIAAAHPGAVLGLIERVRAAEKAWGAHADRLAGIQRFAESGWEHAAAANERAETLASTEPTTVATERECCAREVDQELDAWLTVAPDDSRLHQTLRTLAEIIRARGPAGQPASDDYDLDRCRERVQEVARERDAAVERAQIAQRQRDGWMARTREAVDQMQARETADREMIHGWWARSLELQRDLAAARRQIHRLTHDVAIEGDDVCPHEIRATNLEAALRALVSPHAEGGRGVTVSSVAYEAACALLGDGSAKP